MKSGGAASRRIEWGPVIVVGIGILLFLFGARRFFLRHHFGFADALNCALTVIAAAFLRLVFDYVLHHARLVTPIPLLAAVVLVISSPVFDVALGLTLVGSMVVPAVSEWQRGKNTDNHE